MPYVLRSAEYPPLGFQLALGNEILQFGLCSHLALCVPESLVEISAAWRSVPSLLWPKMELELESNKSTNVCKWLSGHQWGSTVSVKGNWSLSPWFQPIYLPTHFSRFNRSSHFLVPLFPIAPPQYPLVVAGSYIPVLTILSEHISKRWCETPNFSAFLNNIEIMDASNLWIWFQSRVGICLGVFGPSFPVLHFVFSFAFHKSLISDQSVLPRFCSEHLVKTTPLRLLAYLIRKRQFFPIASEISSRRIFAEGASAVAVEILQPSSCLFCPSGRRSFHYGYIPYHWPTSGNTCQHAKPVGIQNSFTNSHFPLWDGKRKERVYASDLKRPFNNFVFFRIFDVIWRCTLWRHLLPSENEIFWSFRKTRFAPQCCSRLARPRSACQQ